MRPIIFILLFGLSLNTFSQKLDSLTFAKIYPHALRGEMEEVFDLLNPTGDSLLTQKQQKIKQAYYERFLTNTEDFDYKADDPVIIDLIKRFQHYWRSLMTEK